MSSASSASSVPSTSFPTSRNSLSSVIGRANTKRTEFDLRRREMNKILEAHKRMKQSQSQSDAENKESSRSARANACDLNGEEFAIVCEELWIDFKTWVNHNKNANDCFEKVRTTIASYWTPMWLTFACLIWFRWYMGAGKDACSYSFGYGVFDFACEVMRYLGEFMFVLLMMITGLCAGLLPIIACLCIYEFNATFPDPEHGDESDEDVGDEDVGNVSNEDARDSEHLKKE